MHVRVNVLNEHGGASPNDRDEEDEEEAQGVGGRAFGTVEVPLKDHGLGSGAWWGGRSGFGRGWRGAREHGQAQAEDRRLGIRRTLHGNCEGALSSCRRRVGEGMDADACEFGFWRDGQAVGGRRQEADG